MPDFLRIPQRHDLHGVGIFRTGEMKISNSARRDAAVVSKQRRIHSEQVLPSYVNPMQQIKLNFERREFEGQSPTTLAHCSLANVASGYNYCDTLPKNSVVRDPEQGGRRKNAAFAHTALARQQSEPSVECAAQPQAIYCEEQAKQHFTGPEKHKHGKIADSYSDRHLPASVLAERGYENQVCANALYVSYVEGKYASEAAKAASSGEAGVKKPNLYIVKQSRQEIKSPSVEGADQVARTQNSGNKAPAAGLEIRFFTLDLEKAEREKTASQIERNIRLYYKILDRADLQDQDRYDLTVLTRAGEARVARIRRLNEQGPAAGQ